MLNFALLLKFTSIQFGCPGRGCARVTRTPSWGLVGFGVTSSPHSPLSRTLICSYLFCCPIVRDSGLFFCNNSPFTPPYLMYCNTYLDCFQCLGFVSIRKSAFDYKLNFIEYMKKILLILPILMFSFLASSAEANHNSSYNNNYYSSYGNDYGYSNYNSNNYDYMYVNSYQAPTNYSYNPPLYVNAYQQPTNYSYNPPLYVNAYQQPRNYGDSGYNQNMYVNSYQQPRNYDSFYYSY